jgi:hypothetical protein
MNTILNSALTLTYNQLSDFSGLDNFWQVFDTAFGTQYNRSGAEILRLQWLSGDFSQLPQIEILDSNILGSANGAYASSTNKIYLSNSFLANATTEAISAVLLEEIGHFVDAQINQTDSAGDEGAIFATLVQGYSLNAQSLTNLRAENDYATITVNGEELIVEQSTVSTTDLNTVTATQLVNTLLGSGITASNITFTGANVAGGVFSGGIGAGIGIENGIILSTGNIAFAQGPNNSTGRGLDNDRPGDSNLDAIVSPLTTNDAAVLEFDFIPSTTTLSFSYVFASEEYYEYVNSSYNDVFAFYLNGQNIALIPGTTTPVSIDTVNAGDSSTPLAGTNSSFFIPNYGTTYNTQFDGFTTVLSANATGLVPGVTNNIKLAIADTSDSILDSAVFIQAGSFGNSTIVTVAATDSDAGEGTTANTGVFTITRTGSTTNALTVNYTISGTASSADYNSIASTVIIPAGQASTTVTVTPVNDTLVEGNETVILSLIDTADYDLGTANSATVIIADDEANNTIINLAVAPASVIEDGATNLVYTFTRQGATTSPLIVNYNVGGSATFNTDYTQTGAASFGSTTGTITFATGASTATLTIAPKADTNLEGNETVALTLASGTNYTIGTATTVTGTIIDDDTPVIALSLNPTTVAEDGTPNLVYTFTRSGNTSTALTVNYGVSGTATLNTDYVQTGAATFTSTAGSITFAAGASTANLTIDPTADTTVESDETVALTLAPSAGYTIVTTAAVTGTITNDDVFTPIESAGNTKLVKDTANKYFTQVGTNTPIAIKNGGQQIYQDIYGSGWQTIAAETVNGVNQVLWKNITGNYLHIWRLDSNWNWVSSEGQFGLNSADAFTQETNFGIDTNGDGIIGNPYGLIESAGNTELVKDSTNKYSTQIGTNTPTAIKNGGQQIYQDIYGSGWQTIAAETVNGVNQVLWKNITGNYLHIWHLDSNWNWVSSEGQFGLNSADAFTQETNFGIDANSDGVIGNPAGNPYILIESAGNTKLVKDAANKYFAQVGTNTPIAIQNSGVQIFPDIYPGWQTLAVETVNGDNQVLWKNTAGNYLHIWHLDNNWNWVSSEGQFALNSADAFTQETNFGIDANADGIIGNPYTSIESTGNTKLVKDTANKYFAQVGTATPIAIQNSGVQIFPDIYPGWQTLAVETVNGDNQVLWKNVSGNYLHIWHLDNSWNRVSSEGQFALNSADAFTQETNFGIDGNGDGIIGNPYIAIV